MKIKQPSQIKRNLAKEKPSAYQVLNALALEDLGYYLSLGTDKEWVTQQRLRAHTLLKFIEDNDLLSQDSNLSVASFDDTFELFDEDLTEEGSKWYAAAVSEWDETLDLGASPINIAVLQMHLMRLRA
eukprot:COSAG01_NODE_313_length_19043_cov_3.917177_10_plen_128_part_00